MNLNCQKLFLEKQSLGIVEITSCPKFNTFKIAVYKVVDSEQPRLLRQKIFFALNIE